jgi:class 3 adenylate cyclase
MADMQSLSNVQGAAGDSRRGGHIRYFYLIRILTTLGGLGVALPYLLQYEDVRGYHVFVYLLGLAYPHVSYFLQAKLELGRRIEHATLVVDAFLGGSIVYFVGYSMLPSVAVLMVTLINPVAFTGFRTIRFGAFGVALGLGVPTVLYGAHFDPQNILYMNISASVFLLSYFTLFAHAVYLRTKALQQSRRELRQQRITIEIEKKRSDSLLHSILPATAAAEFEATGTVAPRRHEAAVLLALVLPDLARLSAEGPPESSVGAIAEVLRAVDAICGRNALEGLSSFGHCYIAAAALDARTGSPVVSALQAALELRQFLDEDAIARSARGVEPIAYSILLHAGPILTGVIDTRRPTFNLFGDVLDETFWLSRAAAQGDVTVSAAVAGRLDASVRLVAGGTLHAGRRSVEVQRVERTAK